MYHFPLRVGDDGSAVGRGEQRDLLDTVQATGD